MDGGTVMGPSGFVQHSQWRWWSSLLAAVLVYVLSMVVATVVMTFTIIGGTSEADILAGTLPAPGLAQILAAAVIGQILTIIAMFVLGRWGADDWMHNLYLSGISWRGNWVGPFVAIAVALFAADLAWQSLYGDVLRADGLWIEELLRQPQTRWAALAAVTLGAALSEELLFRGFLLPPLARTRIGFWGAAVVTTAIWTAIHGYSWQGAVEIMVFGMALSYLLWRTGSILPGILLHGLINASYAVVAITS